MKSKGRGLALAVGRDPREHREPTSPEELADFETNVLAGFVLAGLGRSGRQHDPQRHQPTWS
jgi:hypothetical protein